MREQRVRAGEVEGERTTDRERTNSVRLMLMGDVDLVLLNIDGPGMGHEIYMKR